MNKKRQKNDDSLNKLKKGGYCDSVKEGYGDVFESETLDAIKEHNEMVEMYHDYLNSFTDIDSIQNLSNYLNTREQKESFNQLLQIIRKNLLKEQKEVSDEINKGEIWNYIKKT
jgi:hypothetical protein